MTTQQKIQSIVEDIQNVYNNNRTAKMRAIFEALTEDGITDPRVLRDTAGEALHYDNKGAIYNAWAAWSGRANYVRTHRAAARPTTAPVVTGTDYNAFTFGVEFECGFKENRWYTHSRAEMIAALIDKARLFGMTVIDLGRADHRDRRDAWKVCSDASLSAGTTLCSMIELVSPILSGVDGWQQLEKMCAVMELVGISVNNSCGTHVHLGVKDESWNTLKNVGINYSLAYKAYCKSLHESRRASRWSATYDETQLGMIRSTTCAEDMFTGRGLCADVQHSGHYPNSRYHAVNYVAYHQRKTLEFRQHQGTCDFRKVQSWLKDKMELITWSRNNVLEGYTEEIEAMAWQSDDTRANFLMRALRYAS